MPELLVVSLYGANTHEGRVQISCQSKDFTIQLSVPDALEFAQNIIMGATAAESDASFANWARERLQMPETDIGRALQDMRQYRARS